MVDRGSQIEMQTYGRRTVSRSVCFVMTRVRHNDYAHVLERRVNRNVHERRENIRGSSLAYRSNGHCGWDVAYEKCHKDVSYKRF